MNKSLYGEIDGKKVWQFTLTNGSGLIVKIINYGGTITHLYAPDKNGTNTDVVLGFDNLGGYLQKSNPNFGCIVGRYANRISGASFVLNGNTYQLAANNSGNTLHGGLVGFDKVIWDVVEATDSSLKLHYMSKDGEEGFPGNLNVEVTFSVSVDNSLHIEYVAQTDKDTPVNLTSHSYFNLSGDFSTTHYDHLLTINADSLTEVDTHCIPSGKIIPIDSTPFDFRNEKRIGDEINSVGDGYDHNYVLNKNQNDLIFAARAHDPTSGRSIEMFTTEPGVQFYTGNFLDGSLVGKGGVAYAKHSGFCLEAQHFPDSPHHPNFPNTILRPGEKYSQKTIYKFTV